VHGAKPRFSIHLLPRVGRGRSGGVTGAYNTPPLGSAGCKSWSEWPEWRCCKCCPAALKCWLSCSCPVQARGHNTSKRCPPPPCSVRVCAACGATKQQTPEGKLQQCSGCKAAGRASVFYCSTECANKDWPVHRIVCSDKGMAA